MKINTNITEINMDNVSKLLGDPEDGSKYESLPTCQDIRDTNMNKLRSATLEHNTITSKFIKCQDGIEQQIVNISPKPITKAKYLQSEEIDFYYYFVLKNGSRITAFRVAKAQVGEISSFIDQTLRIYPEGSEIYQVAFEEYFDIRKTVRELRRTFQRIRKRNIQYRDEALEPSEESSEKR